MIYVYIFSREYNILHIDLPLVHLLEWFLNFIYIFSNFPYYYCLVLVMLSFQNSKLSLWKKIWMDFKSLWESKSAFCQNEKLSTLLSKSDQFNFFRVLVLLLVSFACSCVLPSRGYLIITPVQLIVHCTAPLLWLL